MKIGTKVRAAATMMFLLFGVAAPAHAGSLPFLNGSGVWRFFGNCQDCAFRAEQTNYPVTATLTLQNYVQGFALTNANFVSFQYDGSNLLPAYTVTGASLSPLNFISLTGTLWDGGPENFSLAFGPTGYFNMQADRNWQTCVTAVGNCSPADYGDRGNLSLGNSTVPEPATYVLMAAGLGVLGIASRRRKLPV